MPRGRVKGKRLYIVRLYDGIDNQWVDVSEMMSYEKTLAVWNDKTDGGTVKTKFDDIDYYDIFPAGTSMLFADGRGERNR